ncbi:nicotianamine synthase family protein [Spartinivicinus poritis]|uniref:Nicotianamine synthase family protein n=1 Tax=Spartinivicinus poritis TaxID=2994640 RepID=A0ABT5UBD0_9GAMM|nr:nicotianamine synthase family protein [Spartinivicinus sp. A2-2]MDE1463689.1 nicotianamine synthase family protein [Spartinivicinus sp. A2-2]
MTNDKYRLLLDLASYDSQLAALSYYCLKSCDCFTLLQEKLDELCGFITSEANQSIWKKHELCGELDRQLKQLRETAIHALCSLERHQSKCAKAHQLNITPYLQQLSDSIQWELKLAKVGSTSRVLFIGSGSYPLSAFTISQATGATVQGLDIDKEAVKLASDLQQEMCKTNFVYGDLAIVFQAFRPTHIIIASLVEHKWEVLAQLRPLLSLSQKILVRFGNGLKSAFNYPFNPELSIGWKRTPILQLSGVYDAILMEKE